jgi:hypothetical protein
MSLATSVKDYVEITHKLIEIEPLKNYTEFGAVFMYFIFSIGDFLKNFFSFSLFKNIWSIPIIIPDIASAMISEVSVLDGYFHNAFTFLDLNTATATNPSLVFFEKFIIGLINSLFLILPTSTSHLITVRRFVMQGLEAGYIAGLGTVAGNFLWLASIILGWRFFVIPWLSLDIFRYLLGFILLVKYIWDSSKERRMALEDLSKWKIFLLNFLLALTEQSCIYPFISNLSIGPDASILEGFPVENYTQFLAMHGSYLFGILLGSFSLLQFTCWFWENPAFSIYLWITTKSSFKISTSSYYKILNFTFLYATMLCAIASIPYYGLDYTITNPIGLVPQDRILNQKKSQTDPDKLITETAFLGVNPTDKNSRIRDGVHARRERWKQRLIKYQAFDASTYDQGVYDFLTIEDLNYGFDRFWLRRKMRNHQIRFRLFPGPWMRSLKKQLNNPANPSLLNNTFKKGPNLNQGSNKATSGPRVEFFRILFEQFYHPNFHAPSQRNLRGPSSPRIVKELQSSLTISNKLKPNSKELNSIFTFNQPFTNINNRLSGLNGNRTIPKELETKLNIKPGLIYSNSTLRKFVRNVNTRMNLKILNTKTIPALSNLTVPRVITKLVSFQISNIEQNNLTEKYKSQLIYSKRWKSIFSKIQPLTNTKTRKSYQLFRNVAKHILNNSNLTSINKLKLTSINIKNLSTKERKLLELRTQYNNSITHDLKTSLNKNQEGKQLLLHPLNVYLQKEQAFKRKLRYYGTIPMRKLTVGNQSPYFKALMKRGFYYYKPSLRWKKTLYVASMRRGFRKKSRKQRVINIGHLNLKGVEVNTPITTNKITSLGFGSTGSVENTNPPASLYGGVAKLSNKLNRGYWKNVENKKIITKPTHSYTVLGKRASRYRHQIYKDVLQHWYYTPFNRLLLKFDVDAFINRQPKSHFLTKNEERVLHVRRFLLSEHYDTLRWYTYMQHYKTMKTNIGGTKSFANRPYNQQFQGTFKKIRHLFAITPKQGDLYTLKFDQPLYNDNKLKDNVYFHEELLTDNYLNNYKGRLLINPEQITNKNVPDTNSLENVNYSKMKSSKDGAPTYKLKSQLNRASKLNTPYLDVINQSSFLIGTQYLQQPTNKVLRQETSTSFAGAVFPQGETSIAQGPKAIAVNLNKTSQQNLNFVYSELFVKLIKECKKRIHDQTFLKNYITHRIEKREQLNQEQTKELNKRLEKLKIWLNNEGLSNLFGVPVLNQNKKNQVIPFKTVNVLTTGMQKAVNDSKVALAEPVLYSISLSEKKAGFTKLNVKSTYGELTNAYLNKVEEQILNKLNVINVLKNKSDKSNIIILNLEKTKNLLHNTINKFKPILLGQTKLLKTRTDKNLQWWRKKQRVITKRKNARKRDRFKKQIAGVNKKLAALSKKVETEKSNLYKTLYGNYEISDYLLFTDSTLLRKKQQNNALETSTSYNPKYEGKAGAVLPKGETTSLILPAALLPSKDLLSTRGRVLEGNFAESTSLWQGFFTKKLRKKVSSKGRRYRSLSLARYLTATRKPRLVGEGLTKIDNISSLKGSFLTKEEKQENLKLSIKNNANFTNSLKKSQIKKRSRHSWKKRARHQFSRNHYKYRKRHIHGNGKLRVMNKKIKKFKATNELRQWWWDSFLPRYLNNLQTPRVLGPTTKNQEINLPTAKSNLALHLNRANKLNKGYLFNIDNMFNKSKIAFKPLSNYETETSGISNKNLNGIPDTVESKTNSRHLLDNLNSSNMGGALITSSQQANIAEGTNNKLHQSINLTTSLPFYTGWDESLRKFVVTNRLLSRRDSGLMVKETALNNDNKFNTNPAGPGLNNNTQEITFTNAPIQGLNEGTFLYWQTDMPFNSYNIDQFITTNQSFYAPLGWRRFEFRHSILKNYLIYKANNKTKTFPNFTYKKSPLIVSMKNLKFSSFLNNKLIQKQELGLQGQAASASLMLEMNTKKAIARRIKKRYKLLKQMPNQLMYSPTGPLLTEVLPSHYISVFDQQYRFPRNRYLKRNTLKTLKKTTLLAMVDASNQKYNSNNKEFTLRKRVKPRRKYHRKRFVKKEGLIFPRRTKFTAINNLYSESTSYLKKAEDLRWRPSSRSKQKRKEALRLKTKSNKRVKTNPLRLRQLRRREFQQVLKPIQRYIPQNGGFAWPGDYLRLEVVEMPKLKSINIKKTSLKQKINVQPVGIMPRKYLIEKHNIKVLKKKLEKNFKF